MGLTGNILITGGSGTLGHAIVRQSIEERWDCAITVYSRSELRQAQMRQQYGSLRYVLPVGLGETVIADDVTDAELAAALEASGVVMR